MSTDPELELAAALAYSPGNIVISNAQGIIVKASASNAAIYGVNNDSFIGASLYDLEAQGILNPSVSLEVLRTGKEAQVMQVTHHGRIMMTQGYPIFDQNNQLYRVISFATDLTEIRQLKKEYEWLQSQFMRQPTEQASNDQLELPSKSQVIGKIHQLLNRVSHSDASILFLGESGVGKTAFSKLVHNLSNRADGPFIEVNCSTIPESLFESEMFGYSGGAFTGASKQGKMGLIEQAQDGTLFLDEIGELPLAMQAKLLKVLQDGKVCRLGSSTSKQINFRLITATNQALNKRVDNGEFRLDLYYRINVIPISIPPLRDRIEDIPVLLDYILANLNKRYGEDKIISSHLRRNFLNHDWPGNVRELENAMERSYLASTGKMLQPFDDFSGNEPSLELTNNQATTNTQISQVVPGQRSLAQAMDEVEKQLLQNALEHCKGSYELARYLDISQPTASRKLKKHGLN
ncbi:MAG: sigma 54-interacting transcriptional regulator [Gammaproteobacteria bacterium]|nr:sigma 54-interacting transcriptional regulator [Gammaproteobacteria bacterium]